MVKHEIPVYTDTVPINVLQEIQRKINQMLQDGLIENSSSPWNAPLLLVPKMDGVGTKKKWRLVVDFRKLNEVTLIDNFPLPNNINPGSARLV